MPQVQRFGVLRMRSLRFSPDGQPYLDIAVEGAGFVARGRAPADHAKAFCELASARPGDRVWFWGAREAAPTEEDARGTLVVAERAKVTARDPGAPEYETAALARLKGVGPIIAARLSGLGVASLEDIAGLDDDEAAALDAAVSPIRGALLRHDVVGQAREALGRA